MLPWDDRWSSAISGIESGGNYGAVTDAGKGRKVYGKYQVLDSNIGPWTQSALGRAMTPDEFLNDRDAQEAVFKNQFGNYVQKYGTPEDAASAWLTGRPLSSAGNVADRFGTTAQAYAAKFDKALGAPAVQAINSASKGSSMPTPPPDDGFMGSLLNRINGTANGSGGTYDLGDALGNAGASMMALDNAKGAAVLAAMTANNRKAATPKMTEWSFEPQTGTFYRTNPSTGQLETMQGPTKPDQKGPPKITEQTLKHLDDQMEKYDYLSQSATQAKDIVDLIDSGKLDLGAIKNMVSTGRNLAGLSDDQSRAYAQYNRFIQGLVNDNLRLNKGVQTEGDAYRELKAIAANGSTYDNQTAREALMRVIGKAEQAVTTRGAGSIAQHQRVFGDDQLQGYGDIAQGWKDNFANLRKGLSTTPPAAATPAAPPVSSFKIIKGPH
jgi:hypothetical protein